MVVSEHVLASNAGVEILKRGGNAIDAAVAVGFALAVVQPSAGNIGGGGFMLVRMSNGDLHFLDYRETAPAAATANMYLDAQGNVIPELSVVGYKSIAVPGSVAGMVKAQKLWGKLTLRDVMAPAIRLARNGWRLSPAEAHGLHTEELGRFPESRKIFQRNGHFYKPRMLFREPDLARTLEEISQNPDSFYHGALAKRIADAVQKGGGLITTDDLAKYEAKERQPVQGDYRGYQVISAPPPSSGGIALLEVLNILEGYDLERLRDRTVASMHLTVEAFKRAFMDRSELLGDPDFAQIPVAQLIDKKYAAGWRESINPDKTEPANELRRPEAFRQLDRVANLNMKREPTHTTHYSIVDPAGNAVAVTTTLNGSFGSFVTAGKLGFLFNDEMDDFASKLGVPNQYGLIQGEANAIGPEKRPLSAMTPTIVIKDGKLFLVLGSPGGPRIITTVANILMGVIDYHMDIQQSVNAPRFHHQWLPDKISIEPGFATDTIEQLRRRGHAITRFEGENSGYWSSGECIEIDQKTGDLLGATDHRHTMGRAVGY